jgi:hypothetical protein
MKRYFQTYNEYKNQGGSVKATTITAKQLLPALVVHMERMDKQFTLHINGHLPKPIDKLVKEAFEQSHLQKPFYTQHCEHRGYRYQNVSKNRVKIDFNIRYRMSRNQEKWMLEQIQTQLATLVLPTMSTVEKIIVVHDYIAKNFTYEKQTDGSPFAVYTFLKEKKGVCMAYALLFEKMMEQLHIPCYYVIGTANGEGDSGHAWNMVKIDDHWYHIDSTWNHIRTTPDHSQVRYRYFLVSDDDMKKDHQWQYMHYPPCTSDRYKLFHSLYDGLIVENKFYFSHPKNAHLYRIDLHRDELTLKKCLTQRVQFCNFLNGAIYFSNYSNGGYLTKYELDTGEMTVLSAAQVQYIEKTVEGLVVHYKDQHKDQPQEIIQLKAVNSPITKEYTVQTIDSSIPKIIEEHVFMNFDSNYFASVNNSNDVTYEALKISCADGIELLIYGNFQKLTVNIEIAKILEIQLTSVRKEITLQTPAILKIPKKLLKNMTAQLTERLITGEWVAANTTEDDEYIYIKLTKSTQFKFN